MNRPKVSVVIPVYNVELYLKEALSSVINQTLKEIEIIAVNDGSADNSLEIIKKYEKIDNRIILINQKNQGLSGARNSGLEVASGEYIYFMDSDDYIELNTLELCYEKSKKENLDFLLFDSDVFFENLDLEKKFENLKKNREKKISTTVNLGKEVYKELIKNKKFGVSVCTIFIKKEILDKNNIKFYPKILHEDELFTFYLYLVAERATYINEKFFKRRMRIGSIMTSTKSEKNIIGYLTVAKELKKILEKEKEIEKLKLINIKIINMISNAIGILNFLDKNLQNKYKKEIKSEFKNYLNLRSKIKLDYPVIFKSLKKLNEFID